jgi:prepilin-type N-terminal cleavage/methylation domain-containing protein
MGGAERGHLGKEDRRVSNRIEQRRGGFSLVELLLVLSIIGILAGVAIPNMRNVTYRARAAAVDGDLNVLRQATLDYNADRNGWPAEVASGVVPPELSAFLPEGFSFTGEGYELDFENITLPFGLPGNPSVTRMVGAAVTTPDDALSNAIADFFAGSIVSTVGNTHTFVFDAS